MATEVVLASRNDGKLAEMQGLFASLGWKLRSLAEFCDDAAEETASSFVENALLKARHASLVSGLPAIADDSGLEVAALKNIPDERRGARFVCLMVYLRHAEDATPLIAQGSWRGTILHNPRGANGFGYDPLFLVPDLKRSAAELDAEVKNRVSHRGKAARHLYSMIHDAAA